MVKKISAIFLALVLCLSMMVVPVSAYTYAPTYTSGEVKFITEADKTTVKAGDTVTFNLKIDPGSKVNLSAMNAVVIYNSAQLSPVGTDIGTFRTWQGDFAASFANPAAGGNMNLPMAQLTALTTEEKAYFDHGIQIAGTGTSSASRWNPAARESFVSFQMTVSDSVKAGDEIWIGQHHAAFTRGVASLAINGVRQQNTVFDLTESMVKLTVASCEHQPAGEGVVTAPTCTEDGYTTYTCSECGESYTADVVATTGHALTAVEAKAPTCTEVGYEAYEYCSNCNYTTYAEIEATGHDYDAVVTAPTCTEVGYTTYTCACGDKYTADEVAATGHTEGEAVIENATDADCGEAGTYDEVVYCATCGTEMSREQKTTDAVPCQYKSEVTTAPTCTEAGEKTFTCIKCGDTYTEEIAATGHNMVAGEVVAPTCTADGYTVYTCANECGETENRDTVAATGHTYTSEETTAPTCTEAGVKTFTCACGDSYTEAIAALGHTLTTVEAKAPTCTEAGYEAYEYCSACDYTTYKEVAATGHNYVPEVTAPTCTEAGYTTYTCACGDSYTGDEVAATGHSYTEEITKDPTCTRKGEKKFTCACGDTYKEEIPAKGHTTEVIPEVPATCTEAGKTAGEKCTVCNAQVVAPTTVPATGHTYTSEETTAPTCTEAGLMTHTCSVCDATYTEEIAATGHADADEDGVCDNCDESMSSSTDCDHACHKGGILGFFAKIVNFFYRLLNIQQYCDCGELHYEKPIFNFNR